MNEHKDAYYSVTDKSWVNRPHEGPKAWAGSQSIAKINDGVRLWELLEAVIYVTRHALELFEGNLQRE